MVVVVMGEDLKHLFVFGFYMMYSLIITLQARVEKHKSFDANYNNLLHWSGGIIEFDKFKEEYETVRTIY